MVYSVYSLESPCLTTIQHNFILKKIENTVELQWLEHRRIVYHGCFELVLESLGKNSIAADIIIFGIIQGDFLFILIMVSFVYSLESPR